MRAVQAIDARDSWMRRTGPFYPLLVAAQGQTRLPVAADLDPSGEDRERARPWWPAVGAILGLGLGFLGAIGLGMGLGTGVVAALLACIWVLAGGAWAELGAARLGDRLVSAPGGEAAPAAGFTIALVVSLALRVACLLGIYPGAWIEALVVTAVVARWTPVAAVTMAPLFGRIARRRAAAEEEGGEEPAAPPLPGAELIATAVVAIAAIALGGIPGLLALLVAAGVAVAAVFFGAEKEASRLVLATELGALVCFAASSTFPLLT